MALPHSCVLTLISNRCWQMSREPCAGNVDVYVFNQERIIEKVPPLSLHLCSDIALTSVVVYCAERARSSAVSATVTGVVQFRSAPLSRITASTLRPRHARPALERGKFSWGLI